MSKPHLHFTSLSPRELVGDIVETFRLAAEKLGYPTNYVDACFQPGAINILFFFWDVPWSTIAPYHPDCIVVNFEPMVPGTHAWVDNYHGVLKHCYLWEYSQSNFQRNRELRLNVADYVPLAWEEGAAAVVPIEDVLPDAEQDIDVAFFGTMTQRRADVIDRLIRLGLRVELTNGQSWSIEQRDGYLRRAKLVLNFHNWDDSRVVEIGRLSILFRQRKAVVCELYPDSEIAPELRDAVAGTTYDAIVDTVLALLADAPRRAALERAGIALLRQRTQTALVAPALERFLQWRSQQTPCATIADTRCISVCLELAPGDSTEALAATCAALAQRTHRTMDLIVLAPQGCDDLARQALAQHEGARVLHLPPGSDSAAARNLTLQGANGEWIVFLRAGDVAAPDRLVRQAAFLDTHPEVHIVGGWVRATQGDSEPERCAELDHEIKADLLGPQPMRLRSAMFRKAWLDTTGLRFDAEFVAHGDLHFLCKCAAAGARFAALPVALHGEPDATPSSPGDAERRGRLAGAARGPLLARVFPRWTQEDMALVALLYAHMWPAEPSFPERMVETLARGCAQAGGALGTERETLSRVLRREAVRLLQVYAQAGVVTQDWIDERFRSEAVAGFLSPVSAMLPLRPSAV